MMGHDFTTEHELELNATPEQVWAAITTGPGMDAWFLGHNETTPGLGGQQHSDFGGGVMPAFGITAWEPGTRLRAETAPEADGRFLAQEYLLESRSAGTTVLRVVSSGFLPGDDWEAEFEAMQAGNCVFRSSLAEYLAHFEGRKPTPVTVFGPPVGDWPTAWKALDDALGLADPGRGERVHLEIPGLAPIDGELFSFNDQSRSIRTDGAMFRFLQGFFGAMVLCHVYFDDSAPDETAWQDWANAFWS